MKSAVENLSDTLVKLTVEVSFDELKPSMDAAYRKVGQQVRIPGFRPGKVPPAVLDQRVGRAVVLEEAVNAAIPGFYDEAVRENELQVLGQPSVEVTEFNDRAPLIFTAEVEVKPAIELPAYDAVTVTVDDAAVSDTQVEEQLEAMRDRFGALVDVERAVETGDYVILDLAADVEGESLPDASTEGLSYEVGAGNLLDGLDEAVVGLEAGASATFETELGAGEHVGKTAQITVTVTSVKSKDLPPLDDSFATMASEFDTLDELRDDLRERLGRANAVEQGTQARDKVLEDLLDNTEVALPEGLLQAERDWRRQSMQQQLAQMGMTLDRYLEAQGQSQEEFDAEVAETAADALKAQFILDEIATKESLEVSQNELIEALLRRSQQNGMDPQEFADNLQRQGQLGSLWAEVRRGKALAFVLQHATITDESGEAVDLSKLEEFAALSQEPHDQAAHDRGEHEPGWTPAPHDQAAHDRGEHDPAWIAAHAGHNH
ncbi:trigger factor [Acidothermaceae bacterium B102]|nr:trigger factor [Acidothermaceae bacterium B102]